MPCVLHPPVQRLQVYPPGAVTSRGGLRPGAEAAELTVRRKSSYSEPRGEGRGAVLGGGSWVLHPLWSE